MKTIKIDKYHPFLSEIEKKISANFTTENYNTNKVMEYIKDSYRYTSYIDPFGALLELTMSDADYTMFLLKYGNKH